MNQYFYCFEKYVYYVVCKFSIRTCYLSSNFFYMNFCLNGFSCPKNNVGSYIPQNVCHKIMQEVKKPFPREIVNKLQYHKYFFQVFLCSKSMCHHNSLL
jgi:hypothetical protein